MGKNWRLGCDIGHHLSLLYDVPHGASLSVVYPIGILKNKSAYGITKFGLTYFDTDDPDIIILNLEVYKLYITY